MKYYIKLLTALFCSILVGLVVFFITFFVQWSNTFINNQVPKDFTFENWMHDLKSIIQDKPLTELYLIGSHNAASNSINYNKDTGLYNIERSFISKIGPLEKFVNVWAINQSLDIYEQLQTGVRILHISTRQSPDSKVCYDNHSFAITESKYNAQKIYDFLDTHKEEIIIIYFGYSHTDCIEEYRDKLEPFCYNGLYNNETYSELLVKNKRCLIFPLYYYHYYLFEKDNTDTDNTDNTDTDNTVNTFKIKKYFTKLPQIEWFDTDTIQGIINNNNNNDISSQYSFQTITPSSTLMITSKKSGGLYDYSQEIQKNYRENMNIIWGLFDFVNKNLVQLSIIRNIDTRYNRQIIIDDDRYNNLNYYSTFKNVFSKNPEVLSVLEIISISIGIGLFIFMISVYFLNTRKKLNSHHYKIHSQKSL